MKKLRIINSIYIRLCVLCAAFLLAPLVCGLWYAFYSYERSVEEVAKEYTRQAVEGASSSIDRYVQNTSEIMGSVYRQHASFGFSYPNVLEYLSPGSSPGLNTAYKGLVMKNFLEGLIQYQPDYLYNAFLVERSGEVYYASNPRMASSRNLEYDFLEQEWFLRIAGATTRQVQPLFGDEENTGYLYRQAQRPLLLMARNIYDVGAGLHDSRVVATLFLSVDLRYFHVFFDTKEPEIHRFYLVDGQGVVRYSTDWDAVGSPLPYVEGFSPGREVRVGRLIPGSPDDYFVCAEPLAGVDWYIVGETNRNRLVSGFTRMQGAVALIIIAVLLLTFAAFAVLYRFAAKPVGAIFRNLKQMENGRLSGFERVRTRDEFGAINAGLIHMAETLDAHIQRSYIAELRRREADLYVLRSQIRPHFTMNALESIRMHLVEQGDKETAKAVRLLGQILGEGLSNPSKVVPLGEEIAFLQSYMEFQRYRFGERVRLELELDRDLYRYPILKMLIQPIVENSLKHGLCSMESGGVITISAYRSGDLLHLIVMDNGQGIPGEELGRIQRMLACAEVSLEGEHIGLGIIGSRIRTHCGKRYGAAISSIPGQGVVVELTLPGQGMEGLRGEREEGAGGNTEGSDRG